MLYLYYMNQRRILIKSVSKPGVCAVILVVAPVDSCCFVVTGLVTGVIAVDCVLLVVDVD